MSPIGARRWDRVRCWWRLPPSPGGSCLLRQISGSPDDAFWRRVTAEAEDAHLRELRLECLSSGRHRYLHLDILGCSPGDLPARDVGSVWRTEDTLARRRHKFLLDIDSVCDRAVRRRVFGASDGAFLSDIAAQLVRRS